MFKTLDSDYKQEELDEYFNPMSIVPFVLNNDTLKENMNPVIKNKD